MMYPSTRCKTELSLELRIDDQDAELPVEDKMDIKDDFGAWFRSRDLRVMGPPRFRCATPNDVNMPRSIFFFTISAFKCTQKRLLLDLHTEHLPRIWHSWSMTHWWQPSTGISWQHSPGPSTIHLSTGSWRCKNRCNKLSRQYIDVLVYGRCAPCRRDRCTCHRSLAQCKRHH